MPPAEERTFRRDWTIAVGDHAAAYKARREFAEQLRSVPWKRADYASSELIFGELVHNAVRHAAAEVHVELYVDDAVRLRVRDDGPGFRVDDTKPAPPHAETGRGLGIVRAVARDLSVERAAGRSVVTAVLPLSPYRSSRHAQAGLAGNGMR
jgi:anti-sigma regulatory factor (Ser/Thr protein kinase)